MTSRDDFISRDEEITNELLFQKTFLSDFLKGSPSTIKEVCITSKQLLKYTKSTN